MSVILNALGNPEPSAEVSQRLRAIDPKLFLRFIPHLPEHWAVCRGWDEQDDRWAEVRSGNADPARAHDIIGYLPMGCSQAEAPAYLERVLRSYPKEDVSRLADRVLAFNQTGAVQDEVQAAIAEVLDAPDPTGKTKVRRGKQVKVEKIV